MLEDVVPLSVIQKFNLRLDWHFLNTYVTETINENDESDEDVKAK